MNAGFPDLWDTRGFSRALDQGFNTLVANWGETLELIFLPVLRLLMLMEQGLQALPWWVVLALLTGLAWFASRRWQTATLVAALTIGIGLLGVWDAAMATIALMLVATLLSIGIGIPAGILVSRWDRLRTVLLPVLDIMQTMPIFVYLIPFVMHSSG
jgi:glycine betaine/proline transport system permease protein